MSDGIKKYKKIDVLQLNALFAPGNTGSEKDFQEALAEGFRARTCNSQQQIFFRKTRVCC